MERKVHVIPFKVLVHAEKVNEVPKGVEMIQAPKIWNQTKGKGITIAILDTGCDIAHPDLKERIVGGRNFTNDDEGRLMYTRITMAMAPMLQGRSLQHKTTMEL